jgi:hypothetical protein
LYYYHQVNNVYKVLCTPVSGWLTYHSGCGVEEMILGGIYRLLLGSAIDLRSAYSITAIPPWELKTPPPRGLRRYRAMG